MDQKFYLMNFDQLIVIVRFDNFEVKYMTMAPLEITELNMSISCLKLSI